MAPGKKSDAKKSKKKKPPSKTTLKGEAALIEFSKQYLLHGNDASATAKAMGYSERSAHVTGCRLLKKAKERGLIQEELKNGFAKLDITRDEVFARIQALARSEARHVGRWGVRETERHIQVWQDGEGEDDDGKYITKVVRDREFFYEPFDSDSLSPEAGYSVESVKFKNGKYGPEIFLDQKGGRRDALRILAEHFKIIAPRGGEADDDGDDGDYIEPVRVIQPKIIDARIRPREEK